MDDLWCQSLEINFSLVMSSPGVPVMVNGYILPQNAMQHNDNCVFNVWRDNTNSANSFVQQS